jgi:hypothetical protein
MRACWLLVLADGRVQGSANPDAALGPLRPAYYHDLMIMIIMLSVYLHHITSSIIIIFVISLQLQL